MSASGLNLSAEELQAIVVAVYRETGMQFSSAKRDFIERRMGVRLAASGAASVATYLRGLRGDRAERDALVSAFTVNETYFYREEHQLACLSRDLLPDLAAHRRAGDKIRIWSLPCSTGDEPYSIALWLLENWAMVDAYNVEIVGSDIDAAALQDAREGVYSERALARLPSAVREAYFETAHRHHRQIIQDLRESVTFTSANLIARETLAGQGRFDVIFCRNLLIYFDEASRVIAADNLYDRLADGGYLCLGHTESMGRISDRFATRRFADAVVYQRKRDA